MSDLQLMIDGKPLTAEDVRTMATDSRMIAFTIPGQPGHKGRPRFRIVKSRKGRQFDFVQVYTDAKTVEYEAHVGHQGRQAARGRKRVPMLGVLEMHVIAIFKRPGRLKRKADPDGRIPHDRIPDGSNVLKAIEDGLNGVLYVDDKQLVRVTIEKFYQAKEGDPIGVHVVVKPFGVACGHCGRYGRELAHRACIDTDGCVKPEKLVSQ